MPGTLLTNSNILTMNLAAPKARAVAVGQDGRILAVGSEEQTREAAGAGARVLDLGGRTLVPGFNDSHMHVLGYGLGLMQADLRAQSGVRDVPSLIAALRRWAEANPNAPWVLGARYNQNDFPGAAHPTRQELDAAFPDTPVFLSHTSGHAAAANSVALKLAGITRDTADPSGGEIVRDANREPTGVLLESAVGLVDKVVPAPDHAGMIEAIKRASEALLRVGITAASDLGTGGEGLAQEFAAYRQAAAEGARVRLTLYPFAGRVGRPESYPSREAFAADHGFRPDGDEQVRLGPVKLFADGALTTRTAALREPFVDGSGTGMLLEQPEELRAFIVAAHRGGWQVGTHAIGDRAIELVLDAYAAAQESLPASGRRHRIEHCMLLDEELIDRLVRQGVIPTMQPEFVARLGDAYVLGLGEERAARLNPYASLLRAGLPVPFGSDCPVVQGAPLDGVRAAVRRTAPSGRVLGPSERIGVLDALRCYTRWSAYATFDEGAIGTVEPGKRADFAVLSADPAEDLNGCEVVATLVGGEPVCGAEALG